MRNFEFDTMDNSPVWLKPGEIKHPEEVLRDFFLRHDLPSCRFYLWEMFKATVAHSEEARHVHFPATRMVEFLESTFCLIEAASLMNVDKKQEQIAHIQNVSPIQEWVYEDEELLKLIRIIETSMQVEKVFLLGKYPMRPAALGEEYDLLVLVRNGDKRPMEEWESLIKNRSQEAAPVYASVFCMDKINELVLKGSSVLSVLCRNARLVYDAGTVELPSTIEGDPASPGAMRAAHTSMMDTARKFLDGAKMYIGKEEYSLCAFMLHQAAEYALNALIVPVLSYRIKSHNLHKLLRFARRICPEVMEVFPRDTEEENQLFRLLYRSYIHARYKDDFTAPGELTRMLINRIETLMATVEREFREIYARLIPTEIADKSLFFQSLNTD